MGTSHRAIAPALGSLVWAAVTALAAGCRPATTNVRDGSSALGRSEERLAPRLAYLDARRVLWVAAPQKGDRVGVWRVEIRKRTAAQVGLADGPAFGAAMHGEHEAAAWVSGRELHVWREGLEAVPDVGPHAAGVRSSPMRWSQDGGTVAWVQGREGIGGGWLRLYTLGQAKPEMLPLPRLPQPRISSCPVWSADGGKVWVLCDVDYYTRTVLGWSRRERKWYVWRAPLPESPSASSYASPGGEPCGLSGSLLQVAAGAQVFLWTQPENGGVASCYFIILPEKWLPAGYPDPVTFVAPAGVPVAVSPALDRVALVAHNRLRQKALFAWRPSSRIGPGPEPHAEAPIPPDAPDDQQVALGLPDEVFLLAGTVGQWRVLRADLATGKAEDLVALNDRAHVGAGTSQGTSR